MCLDKTQAKWPSKATSVFHPKTTHLLKAWSLDYLGSLKQSDYKGLLFMKHKLAMTGISAMLFLSALLSF